MGAFKFIFLAVFISHTILVNAQISSTTTTTTTSPTTTTSDTTTTTASPTTTPSSTTSPTTASNNPSSSTSASIIAGSPTTLFPGQGTTPGRIIYQQPITVPTSPLTQYCLSCLNLPIQYVCGSDGVTYDNPCRLNCASLTLESTGATGIGVLCAANCQYCNNYRCFCFADAYEPVCASDGLTYANLCSLNCENERRYENGIYTYSTFGCYGQCGTCFG